MVEVSPVPRVALVVPTYEREALLAEALASLVSQPFGDWECVVVDDGGTEGSDGAGGAAALVARLSRGEPRLRYMRLSHTGSHGRARNAGIRATTAPLVAFLDDDDLLPAGALEERVALIDRFPDAPAAFGRVELFGERTGTWPSDLAEGRVDLRRLLRGNPVPLSTVVARREALETAGLFPEEPVATPDYELWLRLARGAPLASTRAVLARYRVHPGNMSRRKALEVEELTRLYDRLEREWDLPASLLAPARRGLLRQRARLAPSARERLLLRVRSLLPRAGLGGGGSRPR